MRSRSIASAYGPRSNSPCRKRRRVWCDVLLLIKVSCTWSHVQSPASTDSRTSDSFMPALRQEGIPHRDLRGSADVSGRVVECLRWNAAKLYLAGPDQARNHPLGSQGNIELAVDELPSCITRCACVQERIIDLEPRAAAAANGVVYVGDCQSARVIQPTRPARATAAIAGFGECTVVR